MRDKIIEILKGHPSYQKSFVGDNRIDSLADEILALERHLNDREWQLVTWVLGMVSKNILKYMRFTEGEVDEIHSLYREKFFDIDKAGTDNAPSSRFSQHGLILVPEEQEYVQGVGVKDDEFDTDDSVEKQKYTAGIDWAYSPSFVTAVSDCTCRHCHPEQWMLDRRNIWIRKIGSLGDEVI